MVRQVAHLDLDTFFASVERILDPALKKYPVIVGANPFGRGVVAGCSYEARAKGVHSAMPIRTAYRLCPEAAFLSGSYIHYAEYSKLVTDLLKDSTPIVEKASVDEFYIDLSGFERVKKSTFDYATSIQRTICGETTLPISFGLATNKLIAKVATTERAKKNEERRFAVRPGEERDFLAPYPIRSLPGIGEVTEREMLDYGFKQIGQLAQTPKQLLSELYGKSGITLWERANGIDRSLISPYREQKSYSREHTFDEDTLNVRLILSTLMALCSELGGDLRFAKFFASKFTLKIRYTDFKTVTKAVNTFYTHSDSDIYKAMERILTDILRRRVRLRLIGVEATNLLQDIEQLYLFEAKTETPPLYEVMDSLKVKYGKGIISYASVRNAYSA